MSSDFKMLFGEAPAGCRAQLLCFLGKEMIVSADGETPSDALLARLGEPLHRRVIGEVGDQVFLMLVWPADMILPEGLVKAEFRKQLWRWPQATLQALSRARQLATWLTESRYCGACGHEMETDRMTAARNCPACGFVSYPRLSPVGMVLITRGDEILLARSHHFRAGLYSALAGYAEAGESIEACIHREVREEVGIEIHKLQWFGSQSWPLSNAMMLGFTAEYAGGELVLQPEEIDDARWFSLGNLPELPHPHTLAYRLINGWMERQKK